MSTMRSGETSRTHTRTLVAEPERKSGDAAGGAGEEGEGEAQMGGGGGAVPVARGPEMKPSKRDIAVNGTNRARTESQPSEGEDSPTIPSDDPPMYYITDD
jgi:hypothetical protein